jgi:hypothetical protein
MSQEQSNERKFRIEVENLFDVERRKIKVKHNKKDGPAVEEEIDFPKSVVQEESKNRGRYDLSSGESLEINLYELGGEQAKFWYVKLPFVADFQFISDSGNKVPLIHEVARNESTGGRTVVFIPTEIDPTSCKLLISPPGGLKENYQTQNITGELAAMGDEIPDDNVSVGDNGPG